MVLDVRKIRQLFEMLASSMTGEIFTASTQWMAMAHDCKSIKQRRRGDAAVTVTHGGHLGFGCGWMSKRDAVLILMFVRALKGSP